MTGWRIGMAVGNPELIDALFRFKSNMDSGIPQAIQKAAIEALSGPQDGVEERNAHYQKRRDKLIDALSQIGLRIMVPKAGFYIWAKIPDEYTSVRFTTELLDKTGIAVTPGTGYGSAGEGYVRLSITLPDDRLDEGIKRLLTFHNS
jgi:LL-diaminopimelate aminotransferase